MAYLSFIDDPSDSCEVISALARRVGAVLPTAAVLEFLSMGGFLCVCLALMAEFS